MLYQQYTTLVGTSQEEGDFCICAITRGPSDVAYVAESRTKLMTLERVADAEQYKKLRMAAVGAESLHIAMMKESNL